jgi:hypothetical protein
MYTIAQSAKIRPIWSPWQTFPIFMATGGRMTSTGNRVTSWVWKNAQNVGHPVFVKTIHIVFSCGKSSPNFGLVFFFFFYLTLRRDIQQWSGTIRIKLWTCSVNYKLAALSTHLPNRRKFGQSGHPGWKFVLGFPTTPKLRHNLRFNLKAPEVFAQKWPKSKQSPNKRKSQPD